MSDIKGRLYMTLKSLSVHSVENVFLYVSGESNQECHGAAWPAGTRLTPVDVYFGHMLRLKAKHS